MSQEKTISKNPARAAGMIMLLILASRILGFVRETLTGQLFSRMETDAFFQAFLIPDLMYYLLVGGALSAAFIPVFTEYLSRRNEREAWEIGNTFINSAILALAAVVVLGMIFAPALGRLVAPGFSGEQQVLLIRLIRMMFPAVGFTAVASLFMGVLNSYQHFFAPAFGPNVYNVFIIAGAAFFGARYGVTGMAIGVVVGAAFNLLTQVIFLREKRALYRPELNWRHPGFRRMLILMAPAVVGLSVTQINLAVNSALASKLAEGSITALRFASRLIQLPLGIFGMAISTAFFPTMTRQIATGDVDGFKATFSRGLRFILFITLPSAMGLIVLSNPIVGLLFQYGRFTAANASATAYALVFYSIGLFANTAILIIPRAFYSLQDTVTPMLVGVSTMVLNVLLNLAFLQFTNLKHGGLALAFSITGVINMLAALILLRRKLHEIDGTRIMTTFVKSLAVSGVMGVVVFFVYRASSVLLRPLIGAGRLFDLIVVGLGLVVGLVVYLGIAHIMKMPELDVLLSMVRRRERKATAQG